MKRLAVFLVAVGGLIFRPGPAQSVEKALSGNLSLSGAWALYPLALKWAEEFRKIHPGVRIDIQAGGAGKGMADALAGAVDIGMVSRNIHHAEIARGAFPLAVAKDAVVATCSAKNPFLRQILGRGMRREVFSGIWIEESIKTWGEALGTGEKTPIRVFTRSDACGAAETWAEFLGHNQEDLKGIGVYGDPGVAEAVRRNPLAVGFNNVNFAYDAKTKKPVSGLVLIPIDLDGNGAIELGENFYNTRDELIRAVAEGRYPSPPARELFFVTKGKPAKKILVEFLCWVLSGGQRFVSETGYITLSAEALSGEMKKVAPK